MEKLRFGRERQQRGKLVSRPSQKRVGHITKTLPKKQEEKDISNVSITGAPEEEMTEKIESSVVADFVDKAQSQGKYKRESGKFYSGRYC